MAESVAVRTPYGRRRSEVLGDVPREERPTTYYGLPVVKRSHYGWLIASYFFVGGLAGAAQLIAQITDLVGGREGREVVRWGRYIALLGSLISPLLLIRDLHTSSRWYNMLRIFRPTSPMSIGSWTLAMFGGLTSLAALGQFVADFTGGRSGHGLSRAFGVPAALAGMVMAIYTGVLLSATSTPLWAAVYRILPPLFGATAVASANAALSLVLTVVGAPPEVMARLERLGLLAGGSQLVAEVAAERAWQREGLSGPPISKLLLTTGGPVVLQLLHVLTGRRWRWLGICAAVATLSGGLLERAEILFAGNKSAESPADYFRFTASPR